MLLLRHALSRHLYIVLGADWHRLDILDEPLFLFSGFVYMSTQNVCSHTIDVLHCTIFALNRDRSPLMPRFVTNNYFFVSLNVAPR